MNGNGNEGNNNVINCLIGVLILVAGIYFGWYRLGIRSILAIAIMYDCSTLSAYKVCVCIFKAIGGFLVGRLSLSVMNELTNE